MSDVKILVQHEDARPTFMLEDVRGADFFRIKTPKTANVPTFALKGVEDFKVGQSSTVPDTHLDKAENKKL